LLDCVVYLSAVVLEIHGKYKEKKWVKKKLEFI
jgi:hypothetical protein